MRSQRFKTKKGRGMLQYAQRMAAHHASMLAGAPGTARRPTAPHRDKAKGARDERRAGETRQAAPIRRLVRSMGRRRHLGQPIRGRNQNHDVVRATNGPVQDTQEVMVVRQDDVRPGQASRFCRLIVIGDWDRDTRPYRRRKISPALA